MTGKIELSIESKNKQEISSSRNIFTIEKDQIFGFEDFFGENTRSFTAKAVDVCRVIEIS